MDPHSPESYVNLQNVKRRVCKKIFRGSKIPKRILDVATRHDHRVLHDTKHTTRHLSYNGPDETDCSQKYGWQGSAETTRYESSTEICAFAGER